METEVAEALGLFLAGGVVSFMLTAPLVWMPRIKQLIEERNYWRTEANYNDERDVDETLRILWDK